jgi:hypothetical protein
MVDIQLAKSFWRYGRFACTAYPSGVMGMFVHDGHNSCVRLSSTCI